MEITVLDPATGILLTPSFHGEKCLGNGEYTEYECCCDACDYALLCFPEWCDPNAIDAYLKQ